MSASTARPSWRVLTGALLLLVAVLPAATATGSAERSLSATSVSCGDTVHVTVELSPPDGTDSWLAEEVVPDGWSVSSASGGLTQETSTGVKFTGAGGGPVTLGYDLTVAEDASGTFAVTGEHRFHPSMDARAATSGAESISVTCDADGSGSSGDTSTGDGDSTGDASPGSTSRSMPGSATCGDTFTVTVELDPPSDTDSWLAEEVVPTGWSVSNANGALSSMTSSGVKFTGAGSSSTTLTYDVSVPADASGTFAVTGEHRFHPSMDARAATSGDESISVTCDTGGSSDDGSSQDAGSTDATRTLPGQVTCGDTFTVTVELDPPSDTDSWLAEEVVPTGWSVSSANGALSSMTDTGVKFTGAGDASTTLTYDVSVPADASGSHQITGEHRFHPSMDARAATGGDEAVSVDCSSTGDGGSSDGSSGDTSGPAASGAERSLPGTATCGDTFTVTVELTPPDGTDSWLAEEVLPDGWSVESSSGALSAQTDTGVKFTGAGDAATTITYTVSVPSGAVGDAQISGEHRFSPSMDARADSTGDTNISVDCSDGPAVRSTPSSVPCDDTFTVTVELTPPDGTDSWLVEETVPSGLTVSNPSGGLSTLTSTGVKFTGAGDAPTTLTYDVAVPADHTGAIDLSGEHRFHPSMDARAAVVGDTSVSTDCGSSGDQGDAGDGGAGETPAIPSWAQPFDADANCVLEDGELFDLIDGWIAAHVDPNGPSDDQLFQGIDAWKQAPGSYC